MKNAFINKVYLCCKIFRTRVADTTPFRAVTANCQIENTDSGKQNFTLQDRIPLAEKARK